jgi:aminoglycoside 6-adenylyltransferase
MRTEREMLDLIINTARNDERVRAVIMNGSKVNPNAPNPAAAG